MKRLEENVKLVTREAVEDEITQVFRESRSAVQDQTEQGNTTPNMKGVKL